MGCNKEDPFDLPNDTSAPPIAIPPANLPPTETGNKPPEAFALIDIPDLSDNIALLPTFTWQPAEDPDEDEVSYDLYVDTIGEPNLLIAENLAEPTFTITEKLHLSTDYYWKVVAKDPKGATVSSTVNTFATRDLNIPETPLTANAGFSQRAGHTSVIFKNKIFVIGGHDSSKFLNDVWTSPDGENWTKISPNFPTKSTPQFTPRASHVTVAFQNKLWIIGGYANGDSLSDIWYSDDGVSWTLAASNYAFPLRIFHSVVVFKDKLWLIGGSNGSLFYPDIWYSANGIDWEEATPEAEFSARSRHSVTVFDDKLWLIGGGGGYSNDVWSSEDGFVWKEEIKDANFPGRIGHSTMAFDNKLWLFGGVVNSPLQNFHDVWYSHNGKDWIIASPAANFSGNEFFSSVVFNDKIWIIGGKDRNADTLSNEVWAFD